MTECQLVCIDKAPAPWYTGIPAHSWNEESARLAGLGKMNYYLESLGCPKNLVDSERILTQLCAEGYAISPSYDEADLVVVNTCGFIDGAKGEGLTDIGKKDTLVGALTGLVVPIDAEACTAGRVDVCFFQVPGRNRRLVVSILRPGLEKVHVFVAVFHTLHPCGLSGSNHLGAVACSL